MIDKALTATSTRTDNCLRQSKKLLLYVIGWAVQEIYHISTIFWLSNINLRAVLISMPYGERKCYYFKGSIYSRKSIKSLL